MRIIVYALGQFFVRYKDKIDWQYVIAAADKEQKQIEVLGEIPVITASQINDMEFDFIAIFSSRLFERIKAELTGEYLIPQRKIVPWTEALREGQAISIASLEPCKCFLRETGSRRIFDFGMSQLSKLFLTKEEFLPWKNAVLEGTPREAFVYNETLYDQVYENNLKCRDTYDAILLWEESLGRLDFLDWACKKARYLLAHTSYMIWNQEDRNVLEKKLEPYGHVRRVSNQGGIFWIVDTQYKRIEEDNMAVYVVTHKRYHVRSGGIYKPLSVGGYEQKGFLAERQGENIAYLNKKLNECTALYWIWKNTSERYVGLNHYRRYFYNNEVESMDNYLDICHGREILEHYDIILPKIYRREGVSLLEQIYLSIDRGLCERAYELLREKLAQKQPDYIEAFDQVMGGNMMFVCNMFVAKREILNRYCEWLFSFLIEAAREIDVEGYDGYSQRVMGFLAERMWTVWLRRNRVKIKELPYTVL